MVTKRRGIERARGKESDGDGKGREGRKVVMERQERKGKLCCRDKRGKEWWINRRQKER